MSTYDNAPPLTGWRDPRTDPALAPPPRCCSTFCTDLVCSVCGNWITFPTLGSE